MERPCGVGRGGTGTGPMKKKTVPTGHTQGQVHPKRALREEEACIGAEEMKASGQLSLQEVGEEWPQMVQNSNRFSVFSIELFRLILQ